MNTNYLHFDLTGQVIKAYYTVHNALGFGFLEKVYENAMMIELRKMGICAEQQKLLKVYYDEEEVGSYFADILVENKVVVELKAAEALSPDHEAQLVNYLRATELEVGLLLNFGKKVEHLKRVLTNSYKPRPRNLKRP